MWGWEGLSGESEKVGTQLHQQRVSLYEKWIKGKNPHCSRLLIPQDTSVQKTSKLDFKKTREQLLEKMKRKGEFLAGIFYKDSS